MAQLSPKDLLMRVRQGSNEPCDYILGVINRSSGRFEEAESAWLDYKAKLDQGDDASIAELARDVLAFSNTEGGLLVFGVTDERHVVGWPPLDSRLMRSKVAPYIGTMVDYEVGQCSVHIGGYEVVLPYIFVPRCARDYPNLLRRDISHPRKGFARKVKYVAGSLFYRDADRTLVEPTGGDIETRATELGFSAASARTRSSFVLAEDRPGARLYAHINDRFVGRESDVAEIIAKYDDVRGRGVSIAGLGGMGKTELAIEVVARLYKSGRFRSIYSGSAKRLLLGPIGPQVSDPCFSDFPGFMRDLGAWLGLDFRSSTPLDELKTQCLADLRSRRRVLLFVDNLETVEDGRLFNFLDHEIPDSVWLLSTSRVHKTKNYIYQKALDVMSPGDAAHLLRHELKRQGLADYASMPITTLEQRAIQLQRHPLMIRWYAWSCHRQPDRWSSGPNVIPRAEVEAFCVGHTLQNLYDSARKCLAAIATTQDQTEVTLACVEAVSGVAATEIDIALDDLECAGLISVAVDDRTGSTTYTTVPLANEPARQLAREHNWENGFSRGLREHVAATEGSPVTDPLARYLLQFDPGGVRSLTPDERTELKQRVDRCLTKPHSFRVPLLALAAECERHSGHIITADDYYREASELIMAGPRPFDHKSSKILLEAATVAKFRSQMEPQIRRAITYLEAIGNIEFAPLRILGMLLEFYARLGNESSYVFYCDKVRGLREDDRWRFSAAQLQASDEALARAAASMTEQRTGTA